MGAKSNDARLRVFRPSRVVACRRKPDGSTDIDKRTSSRRRRAITQLVGRSFLAKKGISTSFESESRFCVAHHCIKLVFVVVSESHADSLHYTLHLNDAPRSALIEVL